MRCSLVIASLLLSAPAAAHAQGHADSHAGTAADSMPPEEVEVRFWTPRPIPQWHTGVTAWILDSRQGQCPVIRSHDEDSMAYLYGGIDSLQLADTSAARSGQSPRTTINLAAIKARYRGCGLPGGG